MRVSRKVAELKPELVHGVAGADGLAVDFES